MDAEYLYNPKKQRDDLHNPGYYETSWGDTTDPSYIDEHWTPDEKIYIWAWSRQELDREATITLMAKELDEKEARDEPPIDPLRIGPEAQGLMKAHIEELRILAEYDQRLADAHADTVAAKARNVKRVMEPSVSKNISTQQPAKKPTKNSGTLAPARKTFAEMTKAAMRPTTAVSTFTKDNARRSVKEPPIDYTVERAEALWDHDGYIIGDLVFKKGQIIVITEKNVGGSEWWRGKLCSRQGLFPANHVRLLPMPAQPVIEIPNADITMEDTSAKPKTQTSKEKAEERAQIQAASHLELTGEQPTLAEWDQIYAEHLARFQEEEAQRLTDQYADRIFERNGQRLEEAELELRFTANLAWIVQKEAEGLSPSPPPGEEIEWYEVLENGKKVYSAALGPGGLGGRHPRKKRQAQEEMRRESPQKGAQRAKGVSAGGDTSELQHQGVSVKDFATTSTSGNPNANAPAEESVTQTGSTPSNVIILAPDEMDFEMTSAANTTSAHWNAKTPTKRVRTKAGSTSLKRKMPLEDQSPQTRSTRPRTEEPTRQSESIGTTTHSQAEQDRREASERASDALEPAMPRPSEHVAMEWTRERDDEYFNSTGHELPQIDFDRIFAENLHLVLNDRTQVPTEESAISPAPTQPVVTDAMASTNDSLAEDPDHPLDWRTSYDFETLHPKQKAVLLTEAEQDIHWDKTGRLFTAKEFCLAHCRLLAQVKAEIKQQASTASPLEAASHSVDNGGPVNEGTQAKTGEKRQSEEELKRVTPEKLAKRFKDFGLSEEEDEWDEEEKRVVRGKKPKK